MDSFTNDFGTFTFTGPITSMIMDTTTCAITYATTEIDTKIDKDWMPYNHFEYEPKWHQKFARIKYQMERMWD